MIQDAVAPATWTYSPVFGHYDEVLDPRGRPRRHWRRLANTMTRLGPGQFARRWQQGRQIIQANGITFNVYGDPQGQERPWPVDPIPLVLDSVEWQAIEAAVQQRATLFNLMLADIYGPLRLLSDGSLPPELIFHNPSFLRACHGLPVPQSVFLHHYAVDMGRSPDGQWWVLSDRTQTPSGLGYALENRMVSAQILPEAFKRSQVRPLNRYFHEYRQGLFELTRTKRENPRVVLLTPGPFNEAYFEHAYLAKHLGYTLVEGADLVVRDERVFLKTLGGLVPVDIILRRQDDSYCDPLSFRGDSVLGAPGLLAAVRAGNVVVANALGTGVLETPALSGFLPALCRTRLAEKLKLPSLATWWCGEEPARRYVLEHLHQLVIKPTFPRFGLHPIFGAGLSAAERDDLRRRIEADPTQYVAQEQMALSTAPVLSEHGGLERTAKPRLIALQGYRDAVLDGPRLPRQAATGDGGHHVELAFHTGDGERLAQDHLQHRTGEVFGDGLAIDHNLALSGHDPDAGDRVLALAGGIGAAQLVADGDAHRGHHHHRVRRSGAGHGRFQVVEGFDVGHAQALRVFFGFIDARSRTSGCCASCGCSPPA